jgi:hypothetical protein
VSRTVAHYENRGSPKGRGRFVAEAWKSTSEGTEKPQRGPRVENRSLTFQETPDKTTGGPPTGFTWPRPKGRDQGEICSGHRPRGRRKANPASAEFADHAPAARSNQQWRRAGARRTEASASPTLGSTDSGPWLRPEQPTAFALIRRKTRTHLTSPVRLRPTHRVARPSSIPIDKVG